MQWWLFADNIYNLSHGYDLKMTVGQEHQMSSVGEQLMELLGHEGLSSLYRGLNPKMLKVLPMLETTMFTVYEWSKDDMLNVKHNQWNKIY